MRIRDWMMVHHPAIVSDVQRFLMKVEMWREECYMKRHRYCCENTVLRHCAAKVVINPKKACCWGYLPDRCETCGRRIPRWMQWKYMKLSLFIEHMNDTIEELKEQEHVRTKRNKRLH